MTRGDARRPSAARDQRRDLERLRELEREREPELERDLELERDEERLTAERLGDERRTVDLEERERVAGGR